MENQPIAFAHYKNGEFLGFRQDSFGSLGKDWAKIYMYSPDQVKSVLKNINLTLGDKKQSVGEFLKKIGADPEVSDMITEAEDKIYEQGQEARAFEVRVIKGPPATYEREFDVKKAEYVTSPFATYDPDEYKKWLDSVEEQKVIEKHYFSMEGQVSLS